jgi:hypothetical protein
MKYSHAYVYPRILLILSMAIVAIGILGIILYISAGKNVSMIVCGPLLFTDLALCYAYMSKCRTTISVMDDSMAFEIPVKRSLFSQTTTKKISWKEVRGSSINARWGLLVLGTQVQKYEFFMPALIDLKDLYSQVNMRILAANN